MRFMHRQSPPMGLLCAAHQLILYHVRLRWRRGLTALLERFLPRLRAASSLGAASFCLVAGGLRAAARTDKQDFSSFLAGDLEFFIQITVREVTGCGVGCAPGHGIGHQRKPCACSAWIDDAASR